MIIRNADRNIEIVNLYPLVERKCREYMVKGGAPDFTVWITQEDISFERVKSEREDIAEGRPVRLFTNAYLESLAVYRKIAEQMPFYDTVLFHGSCIAVDGVGYLFTAKSGTGKSTHARLWREFLGERAVMVNDDKPLIRINADGTATAYGTPWDGKHRLSSNVAVPLRAICILERGTENAIREIGFEEAYPMLLQQCYRPADREAMARTLELLDRLNVKIYRLACNMDIGAAELAYRAMGVLDE